MNDNGREILSGEQPPTTDADEPKTTPDPVASDDEAFDEAVAACINRLEAGHRVDYAWLKQNYPEWHRELCEFVADWGAVEGYSNEIRQVSAAIEPPAESLPPFGDYEDLQEIGSGGMGVIYKAKQISLSRPVAIKMLHNVRHDRRRFEMEAEAAARLDHPNIVSIFEVGEHNGQPYFTMPFIDGSDLSSLVQSQPISPERAAEIGSKIAEAVHYAHQRGILHRDLKPGNILIDSSGEPHVTDFGLAKDMYGSVQLTRTNAIIGTPGYMAPEQAMGQNADVSVATDVYGLGAILYSMLVGEAPFSGSSSMEILRQVVDSNPRGLSSANVADDLKVICRKCLSKNPSDRYASAADVADDLNAYLAGKPIKARPLGKLSSFVRWARRNPTIAFLSSMAAAMLLFGLVSLSLLLHTESVARRAAEVGQARERKLNSEIQTTLADANSARRRAELTLCDAFANYGYAAQEQDRPTEAFLWLTKAAEVAPAERREISNARVAAWMGRVPHPVFAYREEDIRRAAFDASNQWVLCAPKGKGEFRVFELSSGEPVPIEFDDTPTSVAWGTRSGVLWFGNSTGQVMRVNCQASEVEEVANVKERVACLKESADGALLAIGFGKQIAVQNLRTNAQQKLLELPDDIFDVQFCRETRSVVASCENQLAYRRDIDGDQSEAGRRFAVPFELHPRSGINAEKNQQFYPVVHDDSKLIVLRFDSARKKKGLQVFDLNSFKHVGRCFLGESYSCSVPGPHGAVVNGGSQYARVRTLADRRHSEQILHGHLVTRAAISPDAEIVATAGWEQTVRLTEMTEDRELYDDADESKPAFAVLPHQTRVSQLTFSGDSRMLATVQFDGLVRVWNIRGAMQPKEVIEVEPGGNQAGFEPPSHQCLLKGMHSSKGGVRGLSYIDINSGEKHDIVADLDGHLRDTAMSPDGRQYALAVANQKTKTGYVRLVNASDLAATTDEGAVRIPLEAEPRSIAAHPSRCEYAVLCSNGETVIINGETAEPEARFRIPSTELTTSDYPRHNGLVAYSHDGTSILQTGSKRSSGLHVFDTANYRERFQGLQNNRERIQQFDQSPTGSVVAIAGGRSNKVRFLDIETGQQAADPIEHPSLVYSVEFSPDGTYVVSSCRDGQARIFDWRTGHIVTRGLKHDRDVVGACFADGGKTVVTIGNDKLAKVWAAETGQLRCPPIYIGDGMRYLDVNPASNRAVASGRVPRGTVIGLDRPTLSPETRMSDVYLLAELVSNVTLVNSGTVSLSTEEWIQRWRRFQQTSLYSKGM